jgi:hypothetical protein
MDLEVGKTYYFIQETFEGIVKGHSMLSRNSPEVVMYLVDGAYSSDWKRLNWVVDYRVPIMHFSTQKTLFVFKT